MVSESFPGAVPRQETKEEPEFIEISGQRINVSEAKKAIPEFDSLDEKSRDFTLLAWHLSNETREEFLEENPRLVPIIQQCQEYYQVVVMGRPKNFKEKLARAKLMFSNLNATMDPSVFEDERYYLADMYELVRLHILEQRDFERTEKRPGVRAVYSAETAALVKKIIERFGEHLEKRGSIYFPDRYWPILDRIKERELPDDTAQQLTMILRLISADHQFHRGIVPFGSSLIKDLWRFCAIKSDNFSEKRLREKDIGPWNAAGRSFYENLSALDLKKRA